MYGSMDAAPAPVSPLSPPPPALISPLAESHNKTPEVEMAQRAMENAAGFVASDGPRSGVHQDRGHHAASSPTKGHSGSDPTSKEPSEFWL